MRYLVLLALLAAGASACQDAAAPRDDGQAALAPPASTQSSRLDLRTERASLIAAGNLASTAIEQNGVASGLGDALAGDALFLAPRSPTLVGKQAALDWLTTNPIAPSAIQWGVLAADVSNDASQGVTWTRGTFTADLGPGPAEHNGLFLIYWRREAGGGWRIAAFVFNLGGQAGALPPGFGTPTKKHRRVFHEASSQTLLEIDAAFSAASVEEGTGPAFKRFAAPNAMAVGGGEFLFGPEAIGEAFASGPDDVVSWVPRFADVAESGDLGFTVGDATFQLAEVGTFFTKYLTVWQRQNDGRWLFVADFGNSRPGP